MGSIWRCSGKRQPPTANPRSAFRSGDRSRAQSYPLRRLVGMEIGTGSVIDLFEIAGPTDCAKGNGLVPSPFRPVLPAVLFRPR